HVVQLVGVVEAAHVLIDVADLDAHRLGVVADADERAVLVEPALGGEGGPVEVDEELVPDDQLPRGVLLEVDREADLLAIAVGPPAQTTVLRLAVDDVAAAGPVEADPVLEAAARAEVEAALSLPAEIELGVDPVLVEVLGAGHRAVVEEVRLPRV